MFSRSHIKLIWLGDASEEAICIMDTGVVYPDKHLLTTTKFSCAS